MRAFALTLHFYSNKAYNYVREKFINSLPSPRTISKWFQSIEGSPGFCKEALSALAVKNKEAITKNRTVVCNLVMDEMSIRQQVEWTGKKFCGYVDVGTNLDSDDLPEAKEVLVFMVVALNSHWKIPIGYFFLAGLSGQEKANLMNKALRFVHESAVVVSSITFDGAAANFAMARCLGAELNPFNEQDLRPYFKHPITLDNVYIFLDACHMLKLVRNCLASLGVIKHRENLIKWSFLEHLVDTQTSEGLHAATKLRKRHVQWQREKMKVKLAAQTFSNSVADALLFLAGDLKMNNFRGAEATADFCKLFNNLFDIFNSRTLFSKYLYQRGLNLATCSDVFSYLKKCKDYIRELSINSQSVLKSNRKTGFIGFLINIQNLQNIFNDYVCEKKILDYILSYKLSQDHLEIFFSAVRSRGGFNNNPTAKQFESIFKRLLIHSEIKGSSEGNAIAIDCTSVLYNSSSLTKLKTGEEIQESSEYLLNLSTDDCITSQAWHLTMYAEDVISYISGFVVKNLNKCITCDDCQKILKAK